MMSPLKTFKPVGVGLYMNLSFAPFGRLLEVSRGAYSASP